MSPILRLKRTARKSIFFFQRLSSLVRTLPDFIVVGAQKAGTTSLSNYLAHHPHIIGAFGKEIHYFDGGVNPSVDTFSKGEHWYRAHFPLRFNIDESTKVFEATPMYLFHPLAPERIKDLLPNARILAILRNPTDRAVSHYFHSCSRGRESLPIQEAMLAEEERIEAAMQSADYSDAALRYFTYKSRGIYTDQICRYQQHFASEQMLFLSSEEFFAKPGAVLPEVFDFLGVEADFNVPDLAARNVSGNRQGVPEEVYRYLDEYFREPNAALSELLSRDFDW